ncbi:Lrp/AsnC family transcriptional regulator [Actinoallomurus bryophytorum]|uniref:DNA-binding Lrp family transcriptional regulator n=1 Tax=Actinoallomurus bryophytorum TaxID=1490222 RepID=A0A543CPH1_9ACTN|nr:Lrp/AsnC family transcriptional regulator [Actinoallomurus bryophytorum]TQL98984.1 DNA-binding Lrp family transcriptional regulator [Actinoallomurus bryophytorum]
MDTVDRGVIHALQIDGRASFRAIADVLEVSENTVARRYRRLRGQGVLRVVGAVDGRRLGHVQWTIRLRCTPDAAGAVARALAARDDTSFVYLLSGGTEVSCTVQTRSTQDQDALLLDKLPRTSRVVSVAAHLLLRGFVLPGGWQGLAWLSPEQAGRLRPPPILTDDGPVELDDGDKALLRVLSLDGRAPYAELASATGWSETTVKRRMHALRRSGIVNYQLDMAPAAVGFGTQARLWIAARPACVVGVGEALTRHPEIAFAALTTGPTNLVAALNCRDPLGLSNYLTERLAPLKAITAMETAPIIRTVKGAGPLLL